MRIKADKLIIYYIMLKGLLKIRNVEIYVHPLPKGGRVKGQSPLSPSAEGETPF